MRNKVSFNKICGRCGKEFIAYKISTRFCSHRCASLAYKDERRKKTMAEYQRSVAKHDKEALDEIIFLTPTEAAKLLRVTRVTIYNYMRCGILPAYQFRRKTLIRRSDIDKLFDNPNFKKRASVEQSLITEFYTNQEIMEKYGVSNAWIYEFTKKERKHDYNTNLPEITFGKKVGLDSKTASVIITNTLSNHSVLSTYNKISVEAPAFEKIIRHIKNISLTLSK